MGVDVAVEGEDLGIEADAVERDALVLLDALGLTEAELSVVLCDDPFILRLNRDWRGIDLPTDVLSFPQDQAEGPGCTLLGDVIISVETAARQARALHHGVPTEVRVLLVHGLLHLLGHDHDDDGDREQMQAEEVRLLATLGVTADAALVARAG